MDENKVLDGRQDEDKVPGGRQDGTPSAEAAHLSPAEPAAERDGQGRRVVDDNGEPIHWATRSERIIAFVLALVVIGITIAFAYSLSTGDLIRR